MNNRPQWVINIENLLRDNDMTRSDLARSLGVTRQHVTNWLNRNEHFPSEHLEQMCLAFNCTPDALLGSPKVAAAAGSSSVHTPAESQGLKITRRSSNRIGPQQHVSMHTLLPSSDGGTIAQEDDDVWTIPRSLLPAHRGTLVMITMTGDSMEPTIAANQTLLVDVGHTRPTPNGIYLLEDEYGATIMNLERNQEGDFSVWGDNPKYARRKAKLDGSDLSVIGRLIMSVAYH